MWWSCFTYDEKGPYHIWEAETAAEKKAAIADLAVRNAARYDKDHADWLATQIDRIRITRSGVPGPKPKFKHDESTGAYVRKDGKGGIDWYRYQEKILKPLLLPFAKRLKEKLGWVIVQEDGAPAHSSKYQEEVFELWEICKLLWPGNSPDLNAIEPTWFWMKRETTKKGPITSNAELKAAWIKCWEDLPQDKIRAWVDRIPVHIEEIIACKGNNLYREGQKKGQEKKRIY
jgi:hypothetical protein